MFCFLRPPERGKQAVVGVGVVIVVHRHAKAACEFAF